jgi:hypothetical protein
MRRARTTTPTRLTARSGVSKKYTWRICASSGSIASAFAAERYAPAGSVSLSSMLSDWSASCSIRRSSGRSAGEAGSVVIEAPLASGAFVGGAMPHGDVPPPRSPRPFRVGCGVE